MAGSFTPSLYSLNRSRFVPASGTDDTDAIQTAADSLDDSGGGVIVLGPGLYKVVLDQLVVPVGVSLQGAGTYATKLQNTAAGNGWIVQFQGANENPYPAEASPHGWVWRDAKRSFIRDMLVAYEDYILPKPDGVLTTPQASGGGVLVTDSNWMGSQFLCDNVWFNGLWEGLRLDRQLGATVRDCQFWEMYSSGIRLTNDYHSDQGDNKIIGCQIWLRTSLGNQATDLSCIRYNGGSGPCILNCKLWGGVWGVNVDLAHTTSPTFGNVAPTILVIHGGSIEQQGIGTTAGAVQLKSAYGKGGAGTAIGANRLEQVVINPGHIRNTHSLICDGGDGAFKDVSVSFIGGNDGPIWIKDYIDRFHVVGTVSYRVTTGGAPTKFLTCTTPANVTNSSVGSECILTGWADPNDI